MPADQVVGALPGDPGQSLHHQALSAGSRIACRANSNPAFRGYLAAGLGTGCRLGLRGPVLLGLSFCLLQILQLRDQ